MAVVYAQSCALHRPKGAPHRGSHALWAPHFHCLCLGRALVGIARARSPTACGLCCLAALTWHVSGVHLCDGDFIPLCCWIIVCGMDGPHFVYSPVDGHLGGFHILAVADVGAGDTDVQVLGWTHVSISLEENRRVLG